MRQGRHRLLAQQAAQLAVMERNPAPMGEFLWIGSLPKCLRRLDNLQGTAKDFQSKRVRRREGPIQDERTPALDPEALAQERELLVLLREMIDLLPGTYRQVINLRLYQGFSNKEISRRLHVSRGNVAVRMNRATTLLKRRIDARARSLSPHASGQS